MTIFSLGGSTVSSIVMAANATVSYITSGLKAWYRFLEGSGTTTADSSGNGFTATLVNTPTWTSGVSGGPGGALSFNGATQYLDTGITSYAPTSFSVCCWVNVNHFNATDSPRLISDDHTDDGTRNVGFELFANVASFSPNFCVGNGTSHFGSQNSTFTWNTGVWNHFAGVYDHSAETATVYVNGVGLTSTSSGFGSYSAGGFNINVARDPQYNGDYANAIIGDVRIYNRALSSGEVSQIYNKTG